MPEKANEAMLIAGKIKHTFTWLEPPSAMGNITVKDVESPRVSWRLFESPRVSWRLFGLSHASTVEA